MTDARLKETIERIRANVKDMKQHQMHGDPTADLIVALYDRIVRLESGLAKLKNVVDLK